MKNYIKKLGLLIGTTLLSIGSVFAIQEADNVIAVITAQQSLKQATEPLIPPILWVIIIALIFLFMKRRNKN